MNIQPAHDAFAMCLDCADANSKFVRNFFVALTLGDQDEHFALTPCQLREWFFLAAAGDDLRQSRLGDLGTEKWFAGMDRFNCFQKLRWRGFLGNISVRSRLDNSENVV